MFERPVNSPPLLYCCCHLTTRLMSAHFFRGANPTRQCVHACMFTSRTCLCTALQVSLTVHVSVCMRACLPSRTCLCTALQVSLRVHVSVCMRACLPSRTCLCTTLQVSLRVHNEKHKLLKRLSRLILHMYEVVLKGAHSSLPNWLIRRRLLWILLV